MLIKDFRKQAHPHQIKVIDRIISLAKQEAETFKKYQNQQDEIDREVSMIRHEHFPASDLIEADLELIVDPMLPIRDAYANKVLQIQAEMNYLFCLAVYDLNMGHLGFIQRNYEKATKEPFPNLTPN